MTLLKSARRLCLAVLCLTAVFALGVAGSASAANTLLFSPHSGVFPYHLEGLSHEGTSELTTISGKKIQSKLPVHALALILNSTLFHARILFLGVFAEGVEAAKCSDLGGNFNGDVLLNLLGHLGLADPGDAPAVLLLIPSGFSFECKGLLGAENILVLGSIIGLITKPNILEKSEELTLTFETEGNGKQKHKEFLLAGGFLMSDQLLDSRLNGGAFEQAAQKTPPVLLKALPGEGSFLLIDE